MFLLSKRQLTVEKCLQFLIKVFLFFLPWQTIWIYRESYLNGFKWEYGTLGFYGTEILLWVIVFVFMGWYWKNFRFQISDFRFKISKDRIFVSSILLFVVYCLTSSLWALDSDLAWQQGLRIMEMFLLFFVLYLGPLDFKTVVKWFLLGSILPVLLGVYQFVWQVAPAWKWLGLASHVGWEGGASIISGDSLGRVLRAYGSFSHPNVFGGYLVIAILSLFLFSLYVETRKIKILFLIPYSLFLIVLFFTFSRSAFLALIPVLLFYYFSEKLNLKKYLQKIVSTLLPILILIIILIPVLAVRVSGESVYENRSIDERLTGVSESVGVIKNNLWFGVGAGNYTLATYNLNPNLEGWQYQPVHNVVMLIFSELGVVGFILLLFIFLSFFRYQISNIKHNIINYKKAFVFYLLSVICYLILCLFDHYLYSSYIGLMLSGLYWGMIARYSTHYLHS